MWDLLTMSLIIAFLALLVVSSSTEATNHDIMQLHFYMHDMLGTKNATAIFVVNSTNPTAFGSVVVFDDKLTEGPSVNSPEVGRGQGMYIGDSLSKISFLLSFTAVLPNGTISLHGQDPTDVRVREISIIGGTGAYRFCTGYATWETYSIDGLSAVLNIHAYIKKA